MIDERWSQVKRVLAIRLDNLGDVLVTTPALHAIKTSLPAATLTLLTSPVGAEVARLNSDLDDVIVYQAPWMDPWHKLPQDSQREQQMIATFQRHEPSPGNKPRQQTPLLERRYRIVAHV